MIAGRDIVCLSSQDWDELWTRKQRFMQRFARQGNRVLYVETQLSLASVSRLRGDPRRAMRWLAGPRPVERGLWVATLPLVLPGFQMSRAVNRVNNAALAPLLRRWLTGLGFRRPILWTYNPYSESLVGRLGEAFAVYDCVDDLSAARGLVRAETVRDLEQRLLARVRVVFVTHENLIPGRAVPDRPAHLIPNGAELEHFARAADAATPVPAEIAGLPRPVVGFVGSLQYWIDFELLRHLALARPAWSFVLIGPRGRLAAVERVEGLPNVRLMGRRPYEDLPGYVRAFDVCLNPYVLDDTARSCSPLKLYEYLASGKPVVSVDMPEARRFAPHVAIGRTYDEVLDWLEEAVRRPPDPAAAAARMAAVAPHSWDARFREVERALERYLAPTTRGALVPASP